MSMVRSIVRACRGTLFAAALAITLPLAAPQAATPLVDADWLADNLERDDLVILDARSIARADYAEGHIPGALHAPYPGAWRTDRDGVTGVIPSVEKLEAYLSELGIAEDKTVVVVPEGTSSSDFGAAARIYWTLKEVGHDEVSILDGGHAGWVAADHQLETGEIVPEGDLFVASPRAALLISTPQVAEKLQSDAVLLDARPESFFLGKDKHPAAPRFGRLPGARNLDHDRFYDADANRLKSVEAIRAEIPADLADQDLEIVSYCNTGHWAATNWFVLSELLGYRNVTLYDDSMVGWTLDPENAVESDRNRFDDLIAWVRGLFT